MAVEELISETFCVQERIVVRNTSVPCVILLAHARTSSCLDNINVPIRAVAVTSIWRQCLHRSTVLLPVSRSSMLSMAVVNLSSVFASSIRVGHCGLAGMTL